MKTIKVCIIIFSTFFGNAFSQTNDCRAQPYIIEFVTFRHGTMVDSRIPENVAKTIINIFYSIENGNVTDFVHALRGIDFEDGIGLSLLEGAILRFFGNILDDLDNLADDFIPRIVWEKIYSGGFEPKKRYVWTSIEKIGLIKPVDANLYYFKVNVQTYEGKILTFFLGRFLLPREHYSHISQFEGGIRLEWLEGLLSR